MTITCSRFGINRYVRQSCWWSAEQGKCFFFSCSRLRLRTWSRAKGLTVLSRVSSLIFHTQAESGTIINTSSRVPKTLARAGWATSTLPGRSILCYTSRPYIVMTYRYQTRLDMNRHGCESCSWSPSAPENLGSLDRFGGSVPRQLAHSPYRD